MVRKKAVFLDRDGVINAHVYNPEFGTIDSPANPDEFVLLPGAGEAVAALNGLGLGVIVVSNQPGIAKRKFNSNLLQAMTDKMHAEIRGAGGWLDAVYYCLHHPESLLPEYGVRCHCRKPQPGLLLQAAAEWDLDLAASYMVGDGVTDILAGSGAGTTTILVSGRKCYVCEELLKHDARPNLIVASLPDAAQAIRSIERSGRAPREHLALAACFDSRKAP